MDKREPFERLAEARERAGYATATDAARAFGWNENTYRSHENGERGLRPNVAVKYAAALRTTAAYLLTGDKGDEPLYTQFHHISGYIDDHGLVTDYPSQGRDGYDASVAHAYVRPWIPVTRIEAILNRPFLKFSNGDLIFAMVDSVVVGQAMGKYALIELEDGKTLLRFIRQGLHSGSVDIETNPENPQKSVSPKGIYPIVAIVPRGMWTKTPLSEWRRADEEFMAKLTTD